MVAVLERRQAFHQDVEENDPGGTPMMDRTAGWWTCLMLLTAVSVTTAAAAQIVFRSTTNFVTVTVSVRQSGRPIPNLTLQDFAVTDAGYPQLLSDVTYERFPSDVTFVVDLSGSITLNLLETLRTAVASVRQRLGAQDRVSILTFNHRILQRQPLL